mmetsp:Transcript_24183/g.83965  ORF Transcript_24183/g.83965 Transcript_24183/m.83965 type:complete len:236 (+) Transcript_24183:1330-2037(+)
MAGQRERQQPWRRTSAKSSALQLLPSSGTSCRRLAARQGLGRRHAPDRVEDGRRSEHLRQVAERAHAQHPLRGALHEDEVHAGRRDHRHDRQLAHGRVPEQPGEHDGVRDVSCRDGHDLHRLQLGLGVARAQVADNAEAHPLREARVLCRVVIAEERVGRVCPQHVHTLPHHGVGGERDRVDHESRTGHEGQGDEGEAAEREDLVPLIERPPDAVAPCEHVQQRRCAERLCALVV